MLTLEPGVRLGSYQVVSSLGAGGMGEVYRATDTKLGRDVALKILPATFTNDPERLARFRREAQVLAALNHPHIGAIYGLDEAHGQQFLVLELVDGESLDKRIGRGPVPVDEALPIGKQIAEALEAAHDQSIIHRDLKPANIKVRADGTVKVLDFGLAKVMEPTTGSSPSLSMSPTLSMHATQAGIILGTAAYMSPEQARGKAVDKRADIWAFGCVLFEMLTGTRAFPGEDITDTIVSVVSKEPDWSALPAATPASLRRLLARCLKKEPKARMRDIGEARLQLEELISGAPEEIPLTVDEQPAMPGPRWRRAAPAIAAAVVASGIVGAGVWTLRPAPAPPRTVTRFAVPLGEGQQFMALNSPSLAISPDGTALVYVANRQLYLRSMSDREARPIASTEDSPFPNSPVFAPDGQFIAFYSQQEAAIKKIAVSGGAAATIFRAAALRGLTWDASGIVFGETNGRIMRVSANGGQPETLVTVKSGESVYGPALLPGGEWVLFTIATDSTAEAWDKAEIVVQSLKTSERKTLVAGGSDGRYLPTGHLVYALGGVVFAVAFDLRHLTVTSGPVPVVEGVQRASSGHGARFSVSGTGALAFIPGPVATSTAQADLALIDRTGTSQFLKLPPARYEYPRMAPDGKRIAVGSDNGKEAVIWIYDVSGTTSIRRLTLIGRNRVPVWSADGEHVAFQSDREGDLGIFWQRVDGTMPAERLTKPDQETAHVPESWSPDGKTLLFSVANGKRYTVAALSLQDRKAAPFGGIESSIPPGAAFSPDGKWVAYSANDGTSAIANTLFVRPFADGAPYQIAKNGIHPTWAPDGKELFYGPAPRRFVGVSVTTRPALAFGPPVTVPVRFIDNNASIERNNDITPDGKRFLGLVVPGDNTSGTPVARIEIVLNWFEELKARVPTK